MSTFLVLLRFIKPLMSFSSLRSDAYLIGIPTAWFLPGLLRGIEGLSQRVLLAAVLVEPTTLCCVVSRERSVDSLAMLQNSSVRPLLGLLCRNLPYALASCARIQPFWRPL